jgi:hypothetical protein
MLKKKKKHIHYIIVIIKRLYKKIKKVYNHLDYYCPVCLYNVKLYRRTKHCKSLLHLNNLKYCDAQKQICILNSRLENHKLHNKIDAEVKLIIDKDIKNNLIQQSLLDAIRNFNIKIENAMQKNTKS